MTESDLSPASLAQHGTHLFLLGPHGCGKSTWGKALTAHGYVHLSVGLIARLARKRQRPSDIPGRLLLRLARHVPGQPMDDAAARELLDFARTLERVVIDGFPGHADHLSLLDDRERWRFVYLLTPRPVREQRLLQRAQDSLRSWTPGGRSARDEALPDLCRALRDRHALTCVSNAEARAL
ncbi:AAA family ATPase [Paraburkholderia sp. J8-2]|uniref:AAA family ATPase n=1 Tax=Paraburkholderia sp. J8-2 TaxID=2805440 RepID=UPI002AB7630C|nr:AAA family ATPase [Paraburkholderia sp. J8-2]